MAEENGAFDRSLNAIKVWAKALGANGSHEDMMAAAIVAQKRVDLALNSATWLQNNNSQPYNKLVEASGHLGKIVEHLEAGEKIVKDYAAVQLIYEAIQVLKEDDVIIKDSAAAAAAFDKLFLGFGTLAKKFPPPFDSTVGELLSQCGKLAFFSNMRETMVGSGSNMGRAMRLRDSSDRD